MSSHTFGYRRPVRAGAAVGGVLFAGLAPAATWLPAVRLRLFPGLAGLGDAGRTAVTFDDGPHPRATPRLLDTLADLDVRATFFLLGQQAAAYPRIVDRIAREGHEVAVHGWDHRLPVRPWRDHADLRRAVTALSELTGYSPYWYRPPYGILTAPRLAAARGLGLRPVLWTGWAHDWTARATPASVLRELTAAPLGGATLLLHDSDIMAAPGCWRATLRALPGLVAHIRARGLVPGCLGAHGVHGAVRPGAGGCRIV